MWGWMKSEVYNGKMDIGDELPAGVLCAAAHIEKHEISTDEHRDILTRVANLRFSNIYCDM
jgi:hypothetical protein